MQVRSYFGNDWHYDSRRNVLNRVGDLPVGEASLTSGGLRKVVLPFTCDSLRRLCRGHLNQVVLDVTENCNLRCGYCPFCCDADGERPLSERKMSRETARHAVDWLYRGSAESKRVEIVFFGGEPLLGFDLIEYVYEYAMQRFDSKVEVEFSISSNGTLWGERQIAWLRNRTNVKVVITLNGPPEIHDKRRCFAQGLPTHGRILNCVDKILEAVGDPDRISFQCNYANLSEMFRQVKWFRSHPMLSSCRVYYMRIMSYNPLDKEGVLREVLDERMEERFRQVIVRNAKRLRVLPETALVDNSLLPLIHASRGKRYLSDVIGHQGVCTPLCGRCRVDVEGNLFLCEKTFRTPILGNVNGDGPDYVLLDRLHDDINRLFEELKCAECPCVLFCQLCYNHFLVRDKVRSVEVIRKSCARMLKRFKTDLRWYCSLLEANPSLVERMGKGSPSEYSVDKKSLQTLEASAKEAVREAGGSF